MSSVIVARGSRLVEDPLFVVDCLEIPEARAVSLQDAGLVIVLEGKVRCGERVFPKGASFWVPAEAPLEIEGLGLGSRVLFTSFGRSL
jgi:hypothetical protein